MRFFKKITSKIYHVYVFEKTTKGQAMNIKSINSTIGLYQNFGAKNKQEDNKPKLIEKIISRAIINSGTNQNTPAKENQNSDTETSPKDFFIKEFPSDETIETVTTHLKSGTVRTDKIRSDVITGTFIESDFNPPVNGVAKMKIIKNASGDIAQIKTFNTDGQVLKDIIYNRDFNSYYHNAHKPQSIVITDNQGRTTTISNSFFNHRPSQIKSVTVQKQDGSTKTTVIPHSLTDKIKDKAVELQWKIRQSINQKSIYI